MSSLAADLRLALDPDEFARAAGLDGELDDWQRAVLEDQCEFVDSAETIFSTALVEAAFDPAIRPLFGAMNAAA